MDKYNKKAYFHLPGVFEFEKIYDCLTSLYVYRREIFKDNLEIGSIYGCPGYHIWNGGRYVTGHKTVEDLERIKTFMSNANISVRFTYTNCLITEEHTNDTLCNITTSLFHDEHNDILCNSEILEKYLREKYPKYSFISSTTKRLLDIEDVNKETTRDYKLVVLDYALNKDFKTLKKIKHKEKIEILCNAVCMPNCPRRKEHYYQISKAQLNNDPRELLVCNDAANSLDKAMLKPHFISVNDINKYLKLGFRHFKLEGRATHPLDLVEILLYYLIKDEYKMEIRGILQTVVW